MLDIIEQISELMDEHGDYLKRTASIITGDPAIAEDMVQETFMSFYRNRNQFRKDAKTRTYLYRILMNNIKMYYRKNKERECVLETDKAGIVSFENKSVQAMDIHAAVSKLKPA
jgi:RNA polymerase sigma-70 factor (ECF subfamily)